MNSRLIPIAFDDTEGEDARAFREHLRELLQLSPADLDRCLNALSEVQLTRTTRQRRDLFDRLAKASDAEAYQLIRSVSALKFFVDALLSGEIPDDDHRHWTEDLLELQWIEEEQRESLESIIQRLVRDYLSSLDVQSRERSAKGGVLPTFRVIGYTVEVRPIRKDIYRWGADVEDYQPEIMGTVEVASIHLGVDEGPVSDIYFQADEDDVDGIIAALTALKKDMAALRQHLSSHGSAEGSRSA